MSHIIPDKLHNKIILLSGPTASGKSACALKLAEEIDAVIINADSMQIYREIPIITAQPSEGEQSLAPHRLYGFVSIEDKFSVGEWLPRARQEIDTALSEGKTPILVGGTGLYFKGLLHGIADIPEISVETRRKSRQLLDEIGNEALYSLLKGRDLVSARKIGAGNTQRLLRAWEVLEETGMTMSEWQQRKHRIYYNSDQFVCYFINRNREILYKDINSRFESMVEKGVVREIQDLLSLDSIPDTPAMKAHGVPEIISYLQGKISLDEAISRAQKNTRRYAKRQFTWFRNQLTEFEWIE